MYWGGEKTRLEEEEGKKKTVGQKENSWTFMPARVPRSGPYTTSPIATPFLIISGIDDCDPNPSKFPSWSIYDLCKRVTLVVTSHWYK